MPLAQTNALVRALDLLEQLRPQADDPANGPREPLVTLRTVADLMTALDAHRTALDAVPSSTEWTPADQIDARVHLLAYTEAVRALRSVTAAVRRRVEEAATVYHGSRTMARKWRRRAQRLAVRQEHQPPS